MAADTKPANYSTPLSPPPTLLLVLLQHQCPRLIASTLDSSDAAPRSGIIMFEAASIQI